MARVLTFRTTSFEVIPENMLRKSGAIVNSATNRVWISSDPNVAVNNGVPLVQFQSWSFNLREDGEHFVKGPFFAIIETASGTGWFEETEEP